ncbi:MAG: cob(I)yrinic acid a,c-diamide adenosyltransferase [Clostridia bacterium]|nr:cob(I)yrinic acid a,c-diamide adenosyltransferase [Clostridia bacterium]
MPDHATAISLVLKYLTDKEYGVIDNVSDIAAVGHRVVNGGEVFPESTLLTKEKIDKIEELKPETIILDELAVCTGIGLVSEEDMWKLINKALSFGETVVTGRYAPEALMERADYVSEIVKRKHPFDKGIQARKGVEW